MVKYSLRFNLCVILVSKYISIWHAVGVSHVLIVGCLYHGDVEGITTDYFEEVSLPESYLHICCIFLFNSAFISIICH